ncbi:hypothetical protein ACQEV2_39800 [Streptomyces sp. CA-251387]|uniref:hypothetical protein n=1 Tax=Streptomyces sp. CA-251387 TaxID=3240064 RepID=UPI003D91139C
MSAFIQQLPALIGVVIGALGSYVVVVRGDRMRFRREQAARWEERRLTVYADYAQSVKKTVTVTYRVAAAAGVDPHPDPLSLAEAQPLLAEATTARDPSGEALIMLGSRTVVEKARVWVVAAMEMERFVREGRDDRDAWQALLERQRAGREAYYAAVGDDLGLPPGHSARWPLPAENPVPPQR